LFHPLYTQSLFFNLLSLLERLHACIRYCFLFFFLYHACSGAMYPFFALCSLSELFLLTTSAQSKRVMIILLLFLQKQSLAYAVYLFGFGTLLTVPGLKKKTHAIMLSP
jgi:hypothetical protein